MLCSNRFSAPARPGRRTGEALRHPQNRNRSGAALIIVLGLLAVLMLMAMAFAISMRTERGGSSNLRHSVIARQMLDTAITRAMADLNAELGEDAAPAWMAYGSTNRFTDAEHRTANVLSYEAAQYLPLDKLLAAKRVKPGWLAVTAGTSADSEHDVVAGRYSYIILNDTGYLDANLVGNLTTNRLYGTRAAEIRLWEQDGGLSEFQAQSEAESFAQKRDAPGPSGHGRYESMAELYRLAAKKWPNGEINPSGGSINVDWSAKGATNSFALTSFALESWGPHQSGESGSYARRAPKFHISRDLPDAFNVATASVLRAAFDRSFEGARKAHNNLPAASRPGTAQPNKCPSPANANGYIDQSIVAAVGLLDYLDDDILPGRNASKNIDYAQIYGLHWSDLPVTEPVPLFSQFLMMRETGTYSTSNVHANDDEDMPVIAIKHKFPPLSFFGVTVFLNRIVPEASRKDFTVGFYAASVEMDQRVLNAVAGSPYAGELTQAIGNWQNSIIFNGTHNPGSSASPNRFVDHSLPVPALEFTVPVENNEDLPDEIEIKVELNAVVELGNDQIQLIPSQTLQNRNVRFYVSIYLSRERLADGGLNYVGWAYAADPRFASLTSNYLKDSTHAMIWMTRDRARELQSYASDMDPALITWLDSLDPRPIRNDNDGFPRQSNYVSPFTDFLLTKATSLTHCGRSTPHVIGLEWTDWSDTLYFDPSNSQGNSPLNRRDPARENRGLTMIRNDYPESVGELGNLVIAPLRTISLLDGLHPSDSSVVVPNHNVLDYFTIHRPRGVSKGAWRTCKLNGRLNLNPPFKLSGSGSSASTDTELNYHPLTAAFAGLPLNEYGKAGYTMNPIPWTVAEKLAKTFVDDVLGWDSSCDEEKNDHINVGYNREGMIYDLSILGRVPVVGGGYPRRSPDTGKRLDRKLMEWMDAHKANTAPSCDFEREAIIRNSVELFTTRQQMFTIILRADAFTPKFGFSDAGEGTTLSTAHAIVEVWRDPDPERDENGEIVHYRPLGGGSDQTGREMPVHPWFIRYLHQF